jgi:hypothetical protein
MQLSLLPLSQCYQLRLYKTTKALVMQSAQQCTQYNAHSGATRLAVGTLHMVHSAQKYLARATLDSSTRCSKKPGYLSAPFKFVVKHILILSLKL